MKLLHLHRAAMDEDATVVALAWSPRCGGDDEDARGIPNTRGRSWWGGRRGVCVHTNHNRNKMLVFCFVFSGLRGAFG